MKIKSGTNFYTNDKFLEIIKDQQISLQQDFLARLESFVPHAEQSQITFTTGELALDVDRLSQLLPTIGRGKATQTKCLYLFDVADMPEVIKCYEKFTAPVDGQKPSSSISRYNNILEPGNCLYVGSSSLSGLRSRFKQHCGYYQGKNRTFGLKLSKWLTKAECPISIDFYYWVFNNIDQDVLQVLEDGLWTDLRPIFGKQGKA